MTSHAWTAELGARQHFETLLAELETAIAANVSRTRGARGLRRGLCLRIFQDALKAAGCLVAIDGDPVRIRSYLSDSVSYGLAGLAAPAVESELRVGEVTVTFTPGAEPGIEPGPTRVEASSGAVPAGDFALMLFVAASVGTAADRQTIGAYDEGNYREADAEDFLRELRALKAWCVGHPSEAATLALEALRKATPAGEANLRAIIALNERNEKSFRKALDQRLKVHGKLVKARPVPATSVVCWAALMLARFAREIGWSVSEQPFLPVGLLNS